jgi:hypothetical protein
VGGWFGSSAPKARTNTRQKLREREGLNKIIVSASVQPLHPIFNGIASCEYEYWSF